MAIERQRQRNRREAEQRRAALDEARRLRAENGEHPGAEPPYDALTHARTRRAVPAHLRCMGAPARVCRERVVLYGARLLPLCVWCMQSSDSTGRGKRASSPTRCNQQRPPPIPIVPRGGLG